MKKFKVISIDMFQTLVDVNIGDGYSDVVGANRAGITTCWLNRHGANWNHEIIPDYTVTLLIEIASIIGVEMEYSNINNSTSKIS